MNRATYVQMLISMMRHEIDAIPFPLGEPPVSDPCKTLDQLWREGGERSFKAERYDELGVFHVVGKSANGVSFVVEHGAIVRYNQPHDPRWRLHVEAPKPVPHWPAMCQSSSGTWISDFVFPTLEAATEWHGDCSYKVQRLATELPPIMLVPEGKK